MIKNFERKKSFLHLIWGKIFNFKDKLDMFFSAESWDKQLSCCFFFFYINQTKINSVVGQHLEGVLVNDPLTLPRHTRPTIFLTLFNNPKLFLINSNFLPFIQASTHRTVSLLCPFHLFIYSIAGCAVALFRVTLTLPGS